MTTQTIIRKIALVVFKDGKILMVRSKTQKEVFYTLGGKIEPGETDEECLKREVQEEIVCDIKADSLTFLIEFQDIAHGKHNTLLNIRLYKGELTGSPMPSNEIAEIQYFDSTVDKKHLSEIARNKIFPYLKRISISGDF